MTFRLPAFAFVVATAILTCSAPAAKAQVDYYWNAPTGGSGTWDTTNGTWSTTATGPTNYTWLSNGNERANFGNSGGTVTLDSGGISAYGVNFSVSGYTLTGGQLTLTGTGGVIDTGAFAATISSAIDGSFGLTKNGNGSLTLSGTNLYTGLTTLSSGVIAVQNNAALGATGSGNTTSVASGSAIQVSGALTGVTEAITLAGTGIANDGALRNISGLNTWSGGTTLAAGGARINSDSGTLTLSGGMSGTAQPLTVGGAGNVTISGLIATGAGGTITKDGNGTLTLSNGANTFSAASTSSVVITVTAGTLIHTGESTGTTGGSSSTGILPATATPSYVFLNGGTFTSNRVGAGVTFLAVNKGITLGSLGGSLGVTDVTSGNLNIYSGKITGSGNLTFVGPGVLSLTATQTYTGDTRVTAGTLRLRTGTPQIPNTNLIVTGTGSFDAATFTQTIQSLSGDGKLPFSSSTGTLIITGTSSTTFSGVWSAGRINVNKSGGTGTLTIDGINTSTGRFTLTNGTVTVNAGKLLGNPTIDYEINGGTLNLNNAAQSIEGLAGTGGTINLAAGHVFTLDPVSPGTPINNVYSGTIAGPGSIRKINTISGATVRTQTLAGINTYTGTTTVVAGILLEAKQVALYNNTPASWTAANIIVNSGATLAFNVGGTGEFTSTDIDTLAALGTVSGGFTSGSAIGFDTTTAVGGNFIYNTAIANTNAGGNILGVTKLGTNTLTLTGANTYAGTTTVIAGTLLEAKQVALYNNTPASWTATNIIVNSGATLAFNVGGTGEFTSTDIDTLAALGTGTGGFKSGSAIGFDTTTAVGGNFTYNTAIANPNSGANILGVTKLGANILTLTAASTYTGTTTVTAGTLAIFGTGSIATSPVINLGTSGTFSTALVSAGSANYDSVTSQFALASGQTLKGTGTVAGPFTVRAGSSISPGASPGSLILQNGVTTQANSTFAIGIYNGTQPAAISTGLSSVNATSNNFLTITGGMTIFDAGTLITINAGSTTFTYGATYSYKVATGAGDQGATGANLNITNSSQFAFNSTNGTTANTFSLTGDSGGNVYVNFTATPEPGTILGIAAAGMGLAGWFRRRRNG
jgi:fibronectin-binding autotransporter adhesin